MEDIRVYGAIHEVLPVSVYSDWVSRKFPDTKTDEDWEKVYELPEYELVNKILALQIGYYIIRRTLVDGSVVDFYSRMLHKAKLEYGAVIGREYEDYNSEVKF